MLQLTHCAVYPHLAPRMLEQFLQATLERATARLQNDIIKSCGVLRIHKPYRVKIQAH